MKDNFDKRFKNQENSIEIYNANPFDVIEQHRLLESFAYAASPESPFDQQAREQARFACQLLQKDIDSLREHSAWDVEIIYDRLSAAEERYFDRNRHKDLSATRIERSLRRLRPRHITH